MTQRIRPTPQTAISLAAAVLAAATAQARATGVVDLDVGPHADVRSALEVVDPTVVESESFRFLGSAGMNVSVRVDGPRRSRQDFDVALYDPDGVRHDLAAANVVDRAGRWALRGFRLPAAGLWELRVTSDRAGEYRLRLRTSGTGRPMRLDLRPRGAGLPGGTVVGAVIPWAGGVLTPVPRMGLDPLVGTLLDFPAGAFAKDTRVVLTSAPAPLLDDPVRQRVTGPAFRLLPDDLALDRPVRVMTHVASEVVPLGTDPASVRVLAVDARGRRTEIVPTEVQLDRGSVTFETSHAGTFVPWLPRGKPALDGVAFVEMRLALRLDGADAESGATGTTSVTTSYSRSRYLAGGPLARAPIASTIVVTHGPGAASGVRVTSSQEPTFAPSWQLAGDGRTVEVTRQDGAREVWAVADDASVLVQRSGGGAADPVAEFGAAVRVEGNRTIRPAEVAGVWSVGVTGVEGPALRPVVGAGTLELRTDRTWTWSISARRAAGKQRGAEAVTTETDGGTFAPVTIADGVESAQSIVLRSSSAREPRTIQVVFTASLDALAGIAEGSSDPAGCAALLLVGTRRVARIDRRLAEGGFAAASFAPATDRAALGTDPAAALLLVADDHDLRLGAERSFSAATTFERTLRREPLAVLVEGGVPARQPATSRFALGASGAFSAPWDAGRPGVASGGFSADGGFGFLLLPGATSRSSAGLLLFVRSQ